MGRRTPGVFAVSGNSIGLVTISAAAIVAPTTKFGPSAAEFGSAPAGGVSNLAQRFPEYITPEQISALLEQVSREAANVGGAVIENAFTQVFSLLGLVLYLVLVPITVFFLLKDKDRLINAVREALPTERPMINAVGAEMNVQLGNYVRGKALKF